ncbi:hypothetical protein DFH09DRAFT_1411955, partial [Mycena vulgaris]
MTKCVTDARYRTLIRRAPSYPRGAVLPAFWCVGAAVPAMLTILFPSAVQTSQSRGEWLAATPAVGAVRRALIPTSRLTWRAWLHHHLHHHCDSRAAAAMRSTFAARIVSVDERTLESHVDEALGMRLGCTLGAGGSFVDALASLIPDSAAAGSSSPSDPARLSAQQESLRATFQPRRSHLLSRSFRGPRRGGPSRPSGLHTHRRLSSIRIPSVPLPATMPVVVPAVLSFPGSGTPVACHA